MREYTGKSNHYMQFYVAFTPLYCPGYTCWAACFKLTLQYKIVMATNTFDQAKVTAHIEKLDPVLKEIINKIRQIVLETDLNIGERIKWNNPSFYFTGEMPPFDPKEYKRDIAVFNLHKGRIMLVFPSGAKIDNKTGLLEGDYKDGRRIVKFVDIADIEVKTESLKSAIRNWLGQIEK